jgi:hypothetical protein
MGFTVLGGRRAGCRGWAAGRLERRPRSGALPAEPTPNQRTADSPPPPSAPHNPHPNPNTPPPQILGIEERRLNALLRELVGSRKRMLLVQAVSQHRQKRPSDVAFSLNNLISAYRAQPEKGGNKGAVQWGEREEVKELFGTYCAKVGGRGPGAGGWGLGAGGWGPGAGGWPPGLRAGRLGIEGGAGAWRRPRGARRPPPRPAPGRLAAHFSLPRFPPVPSLFKVEDEAKREELADLFGLTEAEREEARSSAGALSARLRQTGADDDESFF